MVISYLEVLSTFINYNQEGNILSMIEKTGKELPLSIFFVARIIEADGHDKVDYFGV